MSLDLSAAKDLSQEKLEALIEMMFLAASADGAFSDTERAEFAKSVESLTAGGIAGKQLEDLLGRAKLALDASDRAERLGSVKRRLPEPEARKLALGLAIQVSAADGIIRTSEREMILETAETLEIDRDEAADLVKALAG